MRRVSRPIKIGGVLMGGGAAVSVQSMCSADTRSVPAVLAQINSLCEAGCDLVRLAVLDAASAEAIGEIKKESPLPIVADIHFDHTLALKCARAGVDKIRINPGNIGGKERVRAVADACGQRKIPIRIGVNGGSLEKDLLEKFGAPTPDALCESALRHVKLLEDCGFFDIAVSLKASDVGLTYQSYKRFAEMTDYPLHLGVTEAGTEYDGVIKSAAGIGALLLEGIGDTIRVSLTADPVREVVAGISLLRALGLRGGSTLTSCPTCGRCRIDMIPLAGEVSERLKAVKKDLRVAVMGCAVNGPGEARSADIGIACGDGCAILFKRGETVGKFPVDKVVDALFDEINKM